MTGDTLPDKSDGTADRESNVVASGGLSIKAKINGDTPIDECTRVFYT